MNFFFTFLINTLKILKYGIIEIMNLSIKEDFLQFFIY